MSLEVKKIKDYLHHSLIIITFFTIKKHLLLVRSNHLSLTIHLNTSHLLIHPLIQPPMHPSFHPLTHQLSHSPITHIDIPYTPEHPPTPLIHSPSTHFPTHSPTYQPVYLPSHTQICPPSHIPSHPPHSLTHPINKYESNTHFAPLA